jgi:hypothetical protein
MSEVFISYKKEDAARVEPIARTLANAGYDVWWDHRIPPGRTYREVIGEALQSAKCVIVVWSNLSANAQWVLDEADEGKKRNVLLPLLLDDVDIPYGFRQIEAARLVEWNNDPAHPEWRAALEAVAHFVGRAPGGPPRPLVMNTMPSAPSTAHVSPAAALKQAAVAEAKTTEKKSGGATLWIIAAVLLIFLGAGGYFWNSAEKLKAAEQDQIQETAVAVAPVMLEARVQSPDSLGFFRQRDGAWIEFHPNGIARFRFDDEGTQGNAVIINDPTRNVRLMLDPDKRVILEAVSDGWRERYPLSDVLNGPALAALPAPTQPANDVIRVWFDGGGGFSLTGDGWAEMSREDGMTGSGRWREESRDADTITLRDDGRQAGARIELGEGQIYLFFPDWNEWRAQWKIRAVDRGEEG